ncbi:ankyrin repeat domain-containing protein [bacterium]|nr:ankyrin repeat domain-containing protein [bacterium]
MTQFRIVSLSIPELSITAPNRPLHLELAVQLMAHGATSGQPDLVRVISHFSGNVAVEVVTESDRDGNTPLLHAAMTGHSETLHAMIDYCSANGVDMKSILNHANSSGETALMLAIAHGKSADCVRVLLANGAHPNTTVASSGQSPLEMAMSET